MGLKINPISRVGTLKTVPFNTKLKFSKEESKKVSSFYREYYGYDSKGLRTLLGIRNPKLDTEV